MSRCRWAMIRSALAGLLAATLTLRAGAAMALGESLDRLLDPHGFLLVITAMGLAALIAWLALSRRAALASEEQFRHLFEDSLQAQMLLRGAVLVAMNRAALKMLGIDDPDYVKGRTPLDFSPEFQPCGKTSAEKASEMVELAFKNGTHHFTWRHRHAQGREFDVDSSLLVVEVRGERLVLCVSRDISEEQAAQAELERYRQTLEALVAERTTQLREAKLEAESANAAKGTFLANMSHEIRTPMNAILGFTQLLQQDVRDPGQREKLDRIDLAGRHLLGVINDVLDLAKIEAGHHALLVGRLDVVQIVRDVGSMLSERAALKGLDLRLDIDPRFEELKLLGDERRIRQILLNFTSNAIKFTERGGVTIRATLPELDEDAALLRVDVIDTGMGIDPEALDRLFQPFVQAQDDSTRRFGGTGLGLVISRHLARLMHGECGASSEPGVGSVFWFTARLQRGTVARDGADAVNAGTPRVGSRILLVEDNEVNRVVARSMLERLGLSVEVASDGRDGADAFAAGHFDLVLMDIHMPVMDGFAATRMIRSTDRGKQVPILAMTASAFAEDRERCLAAGMNGHIAKPVEMAALKSVLAQWLPEHEPAT